MAGELSVGWDLLVLDRRVFVRDERLTCKYEGGFLRIRSDLMSDGERKEIEQKVGGAGREGVDISFYFWGFGEQTFSGVKKFGVIRSQFGEDLRNLGIRIKNYILNRPTYLP